MRHKRQQKNGNKSKHTCKRYWKKCVLCKQNREKKTELQKKCSSYKQQKMQQWQFVPLGNY